MLQGPEGQTLGKLREACGGHSSEILLLVENSAVFQTFPGGPSAQRESDSTSRALAEALHGMRQGPMAGEHSPSLASLGPNYKMSRIPVPKVWSILMPAPWLRSRKIRYVPSSVPPPRHVHAAVGDTFYRRMGALGL